MDKEEKNIPKFDLLDKEQLHIFDEFYLKKEAIGTDFIELTTQKEEYDISGKEFGRILSGSSEINKSYYVSYFGELRKHFSYIRQVGIRPIIKYSLIADQMKNLTIDPIGQKYKIGEYGEYPQTTIKLTKLQLLFNNNKTGRHFTIDPCNKFNTSKKFKPITFDEYESKGIKYIHYFSPIYSKNFFIRVEPIK